MGNFDASVDWIRGRLHLSSITDNYKKNIKFEVEEKKLLSIAEALKSTTASATVALKIQRKQKRLWL